MSAAAFAGEISSRVSGPSRDLRDLNEPCPCVRATLNVFDKVGDGANPKTILAVESPVEDQFIARLCVFSDAHDLVVSSLEVSIDTRFN